MPRPIKCRKVCCLPQNDGFIPKKQGEFCEPIIIKIDEYEAIRLIDRENFSQEQCGEYMNIARTTVQQIYNSGRRKLADALVEGRAIHISGGDYHLCDGEERACGCGGCKNHKHKKHNDILKNKGDLKMKIAIPLDENKADVCQVLARAPYFLFWEDGKCEVVENPAAQAQGGAGVQVAQFIVDCEINVLITPRCGQNAADVFTACGMEIYKTSQKTAMENILALQSNQLEKLTHFHGGFHGIK